MTNKNVDMNTILENDFDSDIRLFRMINKLSPIYYDKNIDINSLPSFIKDIFEEKITIKNIGIENFMSRFGLYYINNREFRKLTKKFDTCFLFIDNDYEGAYPSLDSVKTRILKKYIGTQMKHTPLVMKMYKIVTKQYSSLLSFSEKQIIYKNKILENGERILINSEYNSPFFIGVSYFNSPIEDKLIFDTGCTTSSGLYSEYFNEVLNKYYAYKLNKDFSLDYSSERREDLLEINNYIVCQIITESEISGGKILKLRTVFLKDNFNFHLNGMNIEVSSMFFTSPTVKIQNGNEITVKEKTAPLLGLDIISRFNIKIERLSNTTTVLTMSKYLFPANGDIIYQYKNYVMKSGMRLYKNIYPKKIKYNTDNIFFISPDNNSDEIVSYKSEKCLNLLYLGNIDDDMEENFKEAIIPHKEIDGYIKEHSENLNYSYLCVWVKNESFMQEDNNPEMTKNNLNKIMSFSNKELKTHEEKFILKNRRATWLVNEFLDYLGDV